MKVDDNRRNNGGNSTKAKGVDKRKNEYKTALAEASTVEDVKKVIDRLKKLAFDSDLQAIKLYLAYYLGNPKDTIENINMNHDVKPLTQKEIDMIKKSIEEKY